MMSVSEYANDVDKSIEYIFMLCQKLNISANQEDDMLSDEDIILLDNEIENTTEEEEIETDKFDKDEFEDSYEEELQEEEITVTIKNNKKQAKTNKIKKNVDSKKNDDFAKQKKEMYKHKEKLQSNVSTGDDSIVLYSDGMNVSDLANVLGLNVAEVIKKLMSLGKIMNLNAAIDFETAEIVALDYGKTLKMDTTRDETNFEELEDRKSTRLNSSHPTTSRMPSSA